VGDAVVAAAGGDVLIEEAEPADDRRIGIGQQRIRDAAALCEVAQDLDRIVADGAEPVALGADSADVSLQLDELAFTVRSPIR
jgi:hypothetical protein